MNQHPRVALTYVSGRSRKLSEDIIAEYKLPQPAILVCDVGTSIFWWRSGRWSVDKEWGAELANRWPGIHGRVVAEALESLSELEPQEPFKQSRFKQSYYLQEPERWAAVEEQVDQRLEQANIPARVVFSIQEVLGQGLVDVLPPQAGKADAVRYLAQRLEVPWERIVYAGDSGNDVDALISGCGGVLVANAPDAVRDEVKRAGEQTGRVDRIYQASGQYGCGTGVYSDGVLEGALHFDLFREDGETA